MNSVNKTSRVLGAAFLLQFVTSIFSGAFLNPRLFVPGNISKSMQNIADNAWLMRANILVDMMTAMGIVFLGAVLFTVVRKENEKIALTAMGLYILEASLLAASRLSAYELLRISEEYANDLGSASLQTMWKMVYESMDFTGTTLHMLVFCIGGILFYYLLYKVKAVPGWLSLWGLIAVFPCLAGTLLRILGFTVPFIIYVPYVPFEFIIGIWILVKGVRRCIPQAGAGPFA